MKSWTYEAWILAAAIAGGLVAGLLLGQIFPAMVVALLVYSVWMILRLHRLTDWLANGAKTADTPDTAGLLDSITRLVHREQSRTQRQKDKLRRTLGQFNALATEIPDATVVLDDKWLILWCNSAANNLLGINYKTDRGQRIDNLVRNPEFVAFLHEPLSENREIEIQSPVPGDLTLLVTCVPASDNQLILTARNITHGVQIREMRKAFVADVSHELKTPLTVIEGHLEMLRDDPELNNDQELAVTRMSEHSQRMGKIVNDLLTLSKLESSMLEPDQGDWLPMSGLIGKIIDDTSGLIASSNISAQLDSTLQLLGAESEIHSCCQNLIQNAISHNPQDTRVEIEWKLFSASDAGMEKIAQAATERALDPGTAIFIVRDFGQGIEREHLPRLSQRFYRVNHDRSRESGGTGLGLAIVKYIAHRHGGQLIITSESGEGSVFAVAFPPFRNRRVESGAPDSHQQQNQAPDSLVFNNLQSPAENPAERRESRS